MIDPFPMRSLLFTRAVYYNVFEKRHVVEKPTQIDGLTLEAWSLGYLVGSLVVMGFITVVNMRRGVLLHKLILLELVMAVWQGFWLFLSPPVYAWWLSVSGLCVNVSWSLHNVIAWMKIAPLVPRLVGQIFIWTVVIVQAYWIVEVYANFAYFHGHNDIFTKTRPWEALCRDPWWLFTSFVLFWKIKSQYQMGLKEIVSISPRFGVMLLAIIMSVAFSFLDIFAVTGTLKFNLPDGLNPFWKLSTVFKCLTDCVVLDDFKTALDRLRAYKICRIGSFAQDNTDRRTQDNGQLVSMWEELEAENNAAVDSNRPLQSLVHASHLFPGSSQV